jgi:hypothetical protein
MLIRFAIFIIDQLIHRLSCSVGSIPVGSILVRFWFDSGSIPGSNNTQVLKITKGKVLPFARTSANG